MPPSKRTVSATTAVARIIMSSSHFLLHHNDDAFSTSHAAPLFRAVAARVLWRLQTISCCSACSLSSWTSTSVRVSWPSNWSKSNLRRYEVSCTTRPGCGLTRVSRKSHAVIIKTLEAGTYCEFRVRNVKRYRSYYRYCAGTTSLYSLLFIFHFSLLMKCHTVYVYLQQ